MVNTHHLLVVGVVNLVDQWELLWTQLLVQSGQLRELKEQKHTKTNMEQ